MAELLLVSNPHRRRKSRKNPHHRRRAHRKNPHHRRRARRNPHHRRRVRRNPSFAGLSLRSAMPIAKEGLWGATGALGLDWAYGLTAPYLPTSLTSNAQIAPFVQFLFKEVLAVGVGWAGGKLLRGKGRDLAVGAATVATHDFMKSTLQGMAPSIFGAGGMFALSGYSGLGAYLSGSAPLVGTATFPQTYLPQTQGQPGLGYYLHGSSGMSDGNGLYQDDAMGLDYWGNT